MSQNSDWEKLNIDQQESVNAWRARVWVLIDSEREAFEGDHPELRMNYSFTTEPLIRVNHPVILEEL